MIESEFCIRCGRPYAMYGVWYCDSCIKDLAYEGYLLLRETIGVKLIKKDNEFSSD